VLQDRRLLAGREVGITGVVPPALLAAAEARDFPVLEVPLSTPYLAISEFVTTRLASEQLRTVQRVYDLQRQLTSAVLEPNGRAAVLHLLASAMGCAIALTTPHGALLDAAPDTGAVSLDGLEPHLERARTQHAVSIDVAADGSTVSVYPLGVRRRTRQLLVVAGSGAPTTFDRMVLSGAVTLLSIDAERRLGFSAERQLAAERLGGLALRVTAPVGDRLDALASLGFDPAGRLTVACLRLPDRAPQPPGSPAVAPGTVAAEAVNDVLFGFDVPYAFLPGRGPGGTGVLIAQLAPDRVDLAVRQLSDGAAGSGRAGVSRHVPAVDVVTGLRQAEAALRHADQCRRSVQRYEDVALHAVLLDAVPGHLRADLAATLLAPLDADREGPQLLGSLTAWLRHHGHVGAAASEVAVHRQTLTRRLARCEQLLGISLDSADDRTALWLALTVRQRGG